MTALQIMIPRAIHSSHPDNYRNNAEFVININNNVRWSQDKINMFLTYRLQDFQCMLQQNHTTYPMLKINLTTNCKQRHVIAKPANRVCRNGDAYLLD